MCKRRCDIFCPNLIFSDSITVGAVAGVNSLLIDIPENLVGACTKFCLGLTQAIPDEATINMPVYITIGGDTATAYPLTNCNCTQLVASQIVTRYKYKVQVFRNLTSLVFKVYNLPNNCTNT